MQTVTGQTFDATISSHVGPVIVLFYADWCGFCRQFLSHFDRMARVQPYTCVKANISDEADPLWDRYQIQTVPTVVAFRRGVPVARRDAPLGVGLLSEDLASLLADLDRVG